MNHIWQPGEASALAARLQQPQDAAALEVRGLRKTFGLRTVLEGVDFDVRPGELVVVLGANGSGKSTLLRCVAGLIEPTAGSISVRGRGETAMIFQQIHLVGRRSALDNVCCGALARLPLRRSVSPLVFPQELRREGMACLARVGLADRAAERARRLSGGQQQRVAIARALCQRANVILADEPVAALDPSASEQVMRLLGTLAHDEGLAVAAVLHQPDLARRHADRVVGLLRGRVEWDRPAAEMQTAEVDALYADERST